MSPPRPGLVRLYPRWWRERYGEEFAALLHDLSGTDRRLFIAADVARDAVSVRLRGGFGMRRVFADGAVRRGVYDGLIIAGLLAVDIVLTNVVFPPGPGESDSDPEYLVGIAITAAVIGALLVAVGARGRRRVRDTWGGAKAGIAAGIVVAVMVTFTFLAVNNAFFDIVSQQHDKRVAFAASGWSSMRAYISVVQLESLVVLVPVLGVVGGALGLIGGLFGGFFGGRGPQGAGSVGSA